MYVVGLTLCEPVQRMQFAFWCHVVGVLASSDRTPANEVRGLSERDEGRRHHVPAKLCRSELHTLLAFLLVWVVLGGCGCE